MTVPVRWAMKLPITGPTIPPMGKMLTKKEKFRELVKVVNIRGNAARNYIQLVRFRNITHVCCFRCTEGRRS